MTAASFFGKKRDLMPLGVEHLRDEPSLRAFLARERFDRIVADPYVANLPEVAGSEFIGVPHFAISSFQV